MPCEHSPNTDTQCQHCQSSVPADPMVGRTLGQYTLIRCLGRGGFGAVYEAKHTKIERRAAVKTLRLDVSDPLLAIKRFQREATALGRLRHPLAVRMYEQGQENDGLFYLVMEFIDGETLSARLQRIPKLSEKNLRKLFATLCEILKEAHSLGIIHRDLKPQNIMLSDDDTPRIVDFGLAGVLELESLTQSGVISGTPKYMSPEQWEGLKNTDARSDIYSLGVMMYECISGQLPFDADSPLAWMKKHHFEEPVPIQKALGETPCSLSLQQTIMRAIAKKPQDRFGDISQLQEALLEEKPQAVPTQLPPTIPAPQKRSKPRYSFLVFLMVGFSLVGGAFFLKGETPPTTINALVSPVPASQVNIEDSLLQKAKQLFEEKRWREAEAIAGAAGKPGEPLAKEARQRAEQEELLTECRAAKSPQQLEAAIPRCASLPQEENQLFRSMQEAFFKNYQEQIDLSLSQKNAPGINAAKEYLALLQKILGDSYPGLDALQQQIEEEQRNQNPGPQDLLAQIKKLRSAKKFDEMCRVIRKYIRLEKSSPQANQLSQEMARYDPAGYPSCAP